jgi:hypothetical protein
MTLSIGQHLCISRDVLLTYIKVGAVIRSCQNYEQLKSAVNYIELWHRTLPETVDHLKERINRLFIRRLRELTWEKENQSLMKKDFE